MIILGVLWLIAVILLIIIYITLVKQRYRVEDNEISLADSRLSLISDGFEITKEVTSAVRGYSFQIDSIHKKWNIELTEPSIQKTYSFSDYLKYDLIKDGKSLVEGKAGRHCRFKADS